ncbi:hypothetical protein BGZ73_005096 [Actinomortierella ambigua]|nr:hypothetical protein BGZ73_005096 [Actinomortierella ambigua]
MSPSYKYELHYFSLHGLCTTIRAMMCIGGADWSQKFETFDTWPAVKATTPFGTLPVLTVYNESGEVVNKVPESLAIERFLAKKFGFAGSNDDEEIKVTVIQSLNLSMMTSFFQVLGAPAEQAGKLFEDLKATKIPTWIANCEKALARNGSNGHFVGDKITQADISTSAVMDGMLAAGVEALNEKDAPNMFAMKRKVDSHPRYLAFRKSEEFAKLSAAQEGFMKAKVPSYDFSKAHIFQSWDDWLAVKPTTLLGTLPIPIETTESGEVIEIPETIAIERHLASQLGLDGKTALEKMQVNVVISLLQCLNAFWYHKLLTLNKVDVPKYLEEFKTVQVPLWIERSEKLLKKNGSNGHFVGDKITYADIAFSAMMEFIMAVESMDVVLNEKAALNMYACKRAVDSNPSYSAHRKSDMFRQQGEAMEGFVRNLFGFDLSKSQIC